MNRAAAPVTAPPEIVPEPPADNSIDRATDSAIVAGGIVRDIAALEASPAPPPPPPVPSVPVRIGGGIKQPALVERVAPVYPPMAVNAHVEGMVVLEAVVDRDGRVEDVTILRSIPLLDRAAIDAVRQWRYASLLVSGQPVRFRITVTVTFKLT